jgi:hypothetical protein
MLDVWLSLHAKENVYQAETHSWNFRDSPHGMEGAGRGSTKAAGLKSLFTDKLIGPGQEKVVKRKELW